ncbi:MAG: hypothetical protein VX730_07435 [Pseudomonadota bacterium]|nr:hypothetical protein [Pseudomonadota bacterium]
MSESKIVMTPRVRERLKSRLIELGYGARHDLMSAIDHGNWEELNELRRSIEAHVLAADAARIAKQSMKQVFEKLETKERTRS